MISRISDFEKLKGLILQIQKDDEWIVEVIEKKFILDKELQNEIDAIKRDINHFMQSYPSECKKSDEQAIENFEYLGFEILKKIGLPVYAEYHLFEITLSLKDILFYTEKQIDNQIFED